MGLLLTVLAVVAVGVATLRSGLAGEVVRPGADDLVMWLWFLVPPVLFGRLAVLSPGWAARAAAVLLVLASPLVAGFTYAIGPFDAQPWWEAISGVLRCSRAPACSPRPYDAWSGRPTPSSSRRARVRGATRVERCYSTLARRKGESVSISAEAVKIAAAAPSAGP